MIATVFAGAKEMFSVAILIGVAASIGGVLGTSGLNDFFIGGLTGTLEGLSPAIFLLMLLLLFAVMALAIPSTSGLAAAMMPIVAPLIGTTFAQTASTDALGASVLLFSVALGAINMFIPTQAVVMAQADASRVGYAKMFKVAFPYAIGTLAFAAATIVPIYGTMLA